MVTSARGLRTSGVCPVASNVLAPRTILIVPAAQPGLTYANHVYVCDETTSRYDEQRRHSLAAICHSL